MKKINIKVIILVVVILIIFAFVMFFIYSKNTQTLTCKAHDSSGEMPSKSVLEIKVNKQKIRDMKFTVDFTFPKNLLDQRQSYISYIKQTKPYMQVSITDTGIRLITKKHGSNFIGIDTSQKITIDELKQVLEVQGYKCS